MKNVHLEEFLGGEYRLRLANVCGESGNLETAEALNPFKKENVEIYVALGYGLPYGTLKFLTVLGMLNDAKEKGMLEGVNTLVEATSGSFGLVLASLARFEPFNIRRVVLVMKDDLPDGKRIPPRLISGRLIPPNEGMSTIATARQLGGGGWHPNGQWRKSEEGYLTLDQYSNPSNSSMFEKWAAPQILEQLPDFNILCAPLGTGGTILGLSSGLRNKLENLTVVGVSCAPGHEVPGARDLNGLREVSLPWYKVNERVEVETKFSYLTTLHLAWKRGLYPGASGGMAYFGLIKLLKSAKDAGSLDRFRSKKDGKIRAVVIVHDNLTPYIDRIPVFLTADEQNPATSPLPWIFLQ